MDDQHLADVAEGTIMELAEGANSEADRMRPQHAHKDHHARQS